VAQGSDSTISPLEITICPIQGSKKVKFQFETPKNPCTIKFKVYALSDTYLGADWEGEAVMEVRRKKPRPKGLQKMAWDDNEDCFGCSWELIMDILQCQSGKAVTQAGLERLIIQFLKQKAKKERLRCEAAKITKGREKNSANAKDHEAEDSLVRLATMKKEC
jgi:hypothetical protein